MDTGIAVVLGVLVGSALVAVGLRWSVLGLRARSRMVEMPGPARGWRRVSVVEVTWYAALLTPEHLGRAAQSLARGVAAREIRKEIVQPWLARLLRWLRDHLDDPDSAHNVGAALLAAMSADLNVLAAAQAAGVFRAEDFAFSPADRGGHLSGPGHDGISPTEHGGRLGQASGPGHDDVRPDADVLPDLDVLPVPIVAAIGVFRDERAAVAEGSKTSGEAALDGVLMVGARTAGGVLAAKAAVAAFGHVLLPVIAGGALGRMGGRWALRRWRETELRARRDRLTHALTGIGRQVKDPAVLGELRGLVRSDLDRYEGAVRRLHVRVSAAQRGVRYWLWPSAEDVLYRSSRRAGRRAVRAVRHRTRTMEADLDALLITPKRQELLGLLVARNKAAFAALPVAPRLLDQADEARASVTEEENRLRRRYGR